MDKLEKAQGGGFINLLTKNIRNYAMYIVLVAICVFFNIGTGGRFLSARNISDLLNQTGYVAILAIGMTLILIIRHIDLSVGYVAGFLGAVAATMLSAGLPVFLVIPAILLLGGVVGVYQGTMVSRVGVPAFVTTLAGMFIFRGLLQMVTGTTGTLIVSDEIFKGMTDYLPDIFQVEGLHVLSLIIGGVAIIAIFWSRISSRMQLKRYGFKTMSLPLFILSLIFIGALVGVIIYVLASYNGIPNTAIIVAVVLIIYNFVLNRTKLGRYIYGIGGNPEAAQLSGINVKFITLLVFISMSMLAALSGMLYTSRLSSATPTAGLGFELEAIASSYIGGVAVSGGVGRVTNTIIGALIMSSLTNGMLGMGLGLHYQYVVKGVIFILAVAFDVRTRSKA